MTDDELREELSSLADDFDSLSDDARDDMLFIYNWEAPVWMDREPVRGGYPYTHPQFNEYTYPGRERAVVLAAVLREAIKRLSPVTGEKWPSYTVGPTGERLWKD